jgi:hypothetical protein
MKVPDAIEPAVGYRAWIVENGLLYSIMHMSMWEPHQTFEAMCELHNHEVPDPRCRCGTYATTTFNRLFAMGYAREGNGLFSVPRGVVSIAGQVNLWGGIIPADTGWRAQFAYPKKLLVPYSRWRIAKQVAAAYGVPYKLYNLERKH